MRGLPNVTYCTLTYQSLGNWGRHAMQHAYLYQLWTTGVLLNILLGPPNHDSQNSPDETHELGSWAKNEMMCYELEPWALTHFLCKYGLFWVLEEIFLKSMIVLTWCGSPMKWSHMVWKICPQHLTISPFGNLWQNLRTKWNSQIQELPNTIKCLDTSQIPI